MEPIKLEMILKTFRTGFSGVKNDSFYTISTDSRNSVDRGLFFALKGERFDGHDFVNQAIDNGNTGIVVKRENLERIKNSLGKRIQRTTIFAVEDTLRALGYLASAYLKSMKAKRIAITGSCGKTTTKEIISSILSVNHRVVKTEGNLNNLIGLPLTAFNVESSTDFAVLEMGMNAFGEIKRLTEIAMPHLGLITNIREAHLEGVGSIEGVLRAKWELYENMPEDSICVVNLDDPMINNRLDMLNKKKVTFSRTKRADVMLESDSVVKGNVSEVRLRIGNRNISLSFGLLGLHNIDNLLAAVAVASALDIDVEDIKSGVESMRPVPGRMNQITISDVILIDDTYNANPSSMEGGLRYLSSLDVSRRIAVLADMLELGMESYSLHFRIGRVIAELKNIDYLVLLGREVAGIKEGAVKNGFSENRIFMAIGHRDAASIVRNLVEKGTAILVKGSHSMGMEKVVQELKVIL